MSLGLGSNLSTTGIVTPGIITSNLVLKHNYAAGGVHPISDGSVYLDGAGDYIDCGNGASLQIGATSMTYTAWIRSDGGDGEYIISKRNDTQGAYALYLDSDDLNFLIGSQIVATTTSAILNNGMWHHVAAVYEYTGADDANVYLYIDGVLEITDTSIDTNSDFVDTQNLHIGWRVSGVSGHYWGGYLCNIGFFSAALTQPQIKSIMNKNYAGLTSSEKTNLVSWWNLDEGTGTTANDSHGSNNGSATFT